MWSFFWLMDMQGSCKVYKVYRAYESLLLWACRVYRSSYGFEGWTEDPKP